MPLDTRHRPRESDVRQQRVPAWKPVFSDKLFYFLFGAVAITFIAVGIPMLYRSTLVVEKSWEYTDCIANISGPAQSCSNLLGDVTQPWHNNSNMERCQCVIDISLSGFSGKTTYLFYQLDNYYQDHRFYVISRWDVQLRSDSIAGGTDCDPITSDPFGRPYAPCGEIANSIFNDTISLQKADGSAVVLSGSGIAWDSDVGGKYKNPSYSGDLCNFPGWAPSAVATPPNWPVRACELGKDTDPAYNPWHPRFGSSGRGYENQDFIVWMRVAGAFLLRRLSDTLKFVLLN